MAEATDRPQDAGRSHRKRGQPSAATVSLLARYHEALRDNLAWVLDELEPKAPERKPGMLDADLPPEPAKRPDAKTAAALWDLAIKLARELGTAIEKGPEPEGGAQPARRPRKRVAYE